MPQPVATGHIPHSQAITQMAGSGFCPWRAQHRQHELPGRKIIVYPMLSSCCLLASGKENPYLGVLQEVTSRTAKLAAKWQAVGFVHGVLNTDNMSILGETIDYGPFGFLERFDPDYTPNTTDLYNKRYSFRNQPQIVQWNLTALATSFCAAHLVEKVGRTLPCCALRASNLILTHADHLAFCMVRF